MRADRYAVVSCHVEQPARRRVWRAFESLLGGGPAGFVDHAVAAAARSASGEDETRWLERARSGRQLAPLGHHTHWGGPTQARPGRRGRCGAVVREAEWFRRHGLEPRLLLRRRLVPRRAGRRDACRLRVRRLHRDDLPAAVPRGRCGRGCSSTDRARLRLPSGALLSELPATHSLGMLARGLPRCVARPSPLPRLGAPRPTAGARARGGAPPLAAEPAFDRRSTSWHGMLRTHPVDWDRARINDS